MLNSFSYRNLSIYLFIRRITCRISVKSGLSFGSSCQQRFISCPISALHSPAEIDGRSKPPALTLSIIAIQNKK